VRLDAREGESELVLFVVAGKCGVGQKFSGGALPSAPDLRGRELHCPVIAGKTAVVGGEQIVALCLGDVGEVWLPGIRIEDRSSALVEPVDFLPAQQEDAAQDEFGDAFGMSLGIGEGQSGTPGPAEYLPVLNAQVLADFLNIGDEVPGGVGFERRVRRALAAAALVEIHDAVFLRVKEAARFGVGASARTAVQKNHRLARWVAAFLEVDLVDRRDPKSACVIGLNRRIEPGDGVLRRGCGQGVVGHKQQVYLLGRG